MSAPLTSAVTQGASSLGRIEATRWAANAALAGSAILPLPAREAEKQEVLAIREDLRRHRERCVEMNLQPAQRRGDIAQGIASALAAASTFHGQTRFRRPNIMAPLNAQLKDLVSRGLPIVLALPIGGAKAGNPLKSGDLFLPDVSEWIALSNLAALAEVIGLLHKPGALVVTIPDAGLHSADLGFPAPEVSLHHQVLQRDLAWLGIASRVLVANTTEHLPAEWPDEVLVRARAARGRAQADELSRKDLDEHTRSLVYILNLRTYAWSYAHTALVTAALAGMAVAVPQAPLQDARELLHEAERIAPHYMGVNHALRTLDVPGRIVRDLTGHSDYVRLTVHAKPGEPRPQLDQNNRLTRPALIPMHSLGFRFLDDGQPAYANVFDVEARHRGYRPVVAAGSGRFLYFEESPDRAKAPDIRGRAAS